MAVVAVVPLLRSWEERRREEGWNHLCPFNQKSSVCSEHTEQMSSYLSLTRSGLHGHPECKRGWKVRTRLSPPGILWAKKKEAMDIEGPLLASDTNPLFVVWMEKFRLDRLNDWTQVTSSWVTIYQWRSISLFSPCPWSPWLLSWKPGPFYEGHWVTCMIFTMMVSWGS